MTTKTNTRAALPNRPDASEKPIFRHHPSTPVQLPPGPGRRYDERHFKRLGRESNIVLFVLAVLVLSFVLTGLNIIPDIFGWNAGTR